MLNDVWGRNAADVLAVGWRQLIMRFDGDKWITEREPQPNRRRLFLHVGPFLPGAVVAYGPGLEEGAMKRVSGDWLPLGPQEGKSIRRRAGYDEGNEPCRSGWNQRGVTHDGHAWVLCRDRTVLLARDRTFETRGRAPRRCLGGTQIHGAAIWSESLFLECDGELWRNS